MRFTSARGVRASQQVIDQVVAAIHNGQLAIGARLPGERELAEQFEVSRATVREALRVLESDGLVRRRAGDPRGAEVLGPSSETLRKPLSRLASGHGVDLGELVMFRMMVESTAASAVAATRSPAQLARLSELVAEMRAADAVDEFLAADVRFHDAIAEFSGNGLLAASVVAVRDVVRESMARRVRTHAGVRRDWISRHERLLAAIADADSELAGALIKTDLYEQYGKKLPAARRRLLQRMSTGWRE